MSVLPANTSALPPVEALFYAGWLKGNYRDSPTAGAAHLLAANATYIGTWEDVSGYCEFRLLTYALGNGSAVGGVLIQWSMDGTNVDATEAAATALVGVVYDSGIIAYHMPFVRVSYTNGAVNAQTQFKLRMVVSPTAVGGGGGGAPIIGIVGQGAPGPVALAWPVELTAPQESLAAPNPSAIVGPLAAGLLEPDRALRTRARVLTDEGSFIDDFNRTGATVYEALPGTLTLVAGTALVGTAAAIAALKAGDYVEIAADDNPAVPVWVQVKSIDSATTGTLESAYTGLTVGVAAAARRSPWSIQYTGAGAGIAVAASVVTFTPAPGGAGVALLTRKVGFGGRKGFKPVRILGNPALSAILPNQLGVFGFGNNPDLTVATAFASVRAENATTFRLTVSRDGFLNSYDVTPANGVPTSSSTHIIELELNNHGVSMWLDRELVLDGVGPHLVDPYDDLYAVAGVWNTGNPGGASTLTLNVAIVEAYNLLDARVTQPNASKLQVTAIGPKSLVQSLPAPNPASVLGTTPTSQQLDPDHALRTRARVLTDEGAFYDDFPGAALARALTGTAVFTAGSRAVTGVGSLFTTEVRVGDYVYRNADTYTAAAQVERIESNTALTLRAVYGGLGGAAAASSVVNFDETIVDGAAAGSTITVAGSEVVLTQAGLAALDAVSIARALGAGGLKAGMPARVAFALRLDQRRANQLTFVGLFNAPTLATATAGAYVQLTGTDANTVVRIASATALGVVVSEQLITLPNAAHTDNVIAFEMIVRPDRVEFYTYDSIDTLMLMGVIPAHLLDPYAPLTLLGGVLNTGIVAGATILRIEQVSVLSVNALEAEVFCSDPARLRASAVDITPNGPSSATTTAVAVDVVVNIAATVAGEAYRFSVDGGAGFCIRVDGVNPVVTDETWYDGMKANFIATVTSASGVRCIKKTAGTANGSCTVTRRV